LQQMGLTPDQVVFVGHKSYELDGASAVGMRTIAFNYEEGANADFYVDHFAELLQTSTFNGQPAQR